MKESQLDLSRLTGSVSLQTRAATAGRTLGTEREIERSPAPERARPRGRRAQGASASAGPLADRPSVPAAEVKMESEELPGYPSSCATGLESVERKARGPGAS